MPAWRYVGGLGSQAPASLGEVINARPAAKTETADQLTAAVARLPGRHVVRLMSAKRTTRGVPCELLVVDVGNRTPRARTVT